MSIFSEGIFKYQNFITGILLSLLTHEKDPYCAKISGFNIPFESCKGSLLIPKSFNKAETIYY